jgi:excinuclease ABC subunit A
VLYVLDEPSIGLHQRDNDRLLTTLKNLRDQGNTVIVVEHDEEAIREADYVFDIGPGAGVHGGQIVAQGTPAEIAADPPHHRAIPLRRARDRGAGRTPQGQGQEADSWSRPRGNNLKDVTADFPLGKFVCVTGVSGGGKSTLTIETLFKTASMKLNGAREQTPAPCETIKGLEHLDKVIDIDQRRSAARRARTPPPTPAPSPRSATGSRACRRPRRAATSPGASPSTSRAAAARPARATASSRSRCTSCPTST